MDIRQTITDKIITMLEKGGNEFRARWTAAAKRGFPTNGKTGAAYQGVNVLILWDEAIERGYASNVWMTYKQAEGMGANVRKGEKGTMACFFEMKPRKAGEADQGEGEEGSKPGFFPMCKAFWLFNVAQIDGLPESFAAPVETANEFNPIEEAEKLLAASGAAIRHGFDSAFYAPGKDLICLPDRECFTSTEAYYAVATHELGHWTGAKPRLNRQFGKRFGDEAYAMEELVAEFTSSYLAGHLGFVDSTIEGHAAYLDSWLKVLKNDKTAIFTACKQAGLAFDFIIGKTPAEARAE